MHDFQIIIQFVKAIIGYDKSLLEKDLASQSVIEVGYQVNFSSTELMVDVF